MDNIELIPVSKDGAYMEIHPTALTQHLQIGWKQCEKQKPAEGEKKPSDGLTVDQLKAALTEKGIAIPEGAKKADLAALLDA